MATHPRPWRALVQAAVLLAAHLSLMEQHAMAAPTRTSGGVKATIPIEFARNQVRVPVSINGSAPFRLILDTGMPSRGVLLRHSDRIDSLALAFAHNANIRGGGSGGDFVTRVAPDARIGVGSLELTGVPIIVLPPESELLQEVDGVIGLELFERFAVRIDVDHLQIEFVESAALEPAPGSTRIPLKLRENKPFVEARVTVNEKPVKVDLALDTGAGHALWLNEGKNGRLAPPPGAIETRLGSGLSGDIHGHIGRVQRLELGNLAFDGVITLFPISEHRNPGGVDFRDGFIGNEVLTRFVVTLDYHGKQLLLERGDMFAEPFEYDMSGMVLDFFGVESRRVSAVLPASPAAAAGIEPGDALVAIDGKTVAELGDKGMFDALTRDGAVIRVTLERKGERIEKTFTLRRLL